MKNRIIQLTILGTSLLFAGDVFAQNKSPSAPGEPTPKIDQKACADRERQTLGDTQETQGSGVKENLSDKLARTDGVICPPSDLDPNLRVPAPGGGKTPVIPPPGSPGGDLSVQPK